MSRLRNIIFLVLIACLPINLGKHFITSYSYISGIVVDYLVPTVYLQDILVGLLLTLWLLDPYKSKINWTKNSVLISLFFFSVSCFLSFLVSGLPQLSVIYFIRILFAVLLVFYVNAEYGKDFTVDNLLKVLALSVIFISLLGIAQFVNQGSIFNNYLFLGEQPYSSNNKSILKENVLGNYVIPPYSLFRHPNTFAGFLTLCLFFIFAMWKTKKGYIYWLSLSLGSCCLLLSLSVVAFIAFLVGILIWVLYKNGKPVYVYTCYFVTVTLLFGFSIPAFKDISFIQQIPSIYRRVELMINGYRVLPHYIPFGIGLGTSTSLYIHSVFLSRDFSFFQPVHNIFMLLLVECGLLSFIFLLLMFFFLLKRSRINIYGLIFIAQIAVLGSFDHYLLTMHQTLYLFMLLVGVTLATSDLLAKK